MRSLACTVALAVLAFALPSRAETDVYLLIGQSNMAGRGKLTPADVLPCDGVLKMNVYGSLVPAKEPLHFDKPSAGAGLGLSFARAMRAADTNRTIVLVPCAFGGSKLSEWAKGRYMYDHAVLRTRHALKALKGKGRLAGILWHQGESDCTERLSATYGRRFAQMIADLRADLDAADVPLVVGELGPYLAENHAKSGQFPCFEAVNAALHQAAKDVPRCACVSADGLKPNADILHFDTASLRVFGERYAAAMRKLQSESRR